MNDDSQEYDILDNKYNLIKTIGLGATATVKLAQEIGKSEILAIKLLKNSDSQTKNFNLKNFNSEINTLRKLNHENIINLIDSGNGTVKKVNGITKQKNYIVLEYAENSELFDFIYFPKRGLGEKIGKGLFKQLLSGLDACHKSGVAHRDLKTENLMLTDKYQVKIADFGFATNIEGKNESNLLTTFLGTLSYASPEVISKKFYKGAPSDIFSCGVILFIIVTGKLPFCKAAVQDTYYRNFIRKDAESFWKMMEPRLEVKVSNEFKSILNSIFTYDAEQRITMDELMNHAWLKTDMPTTEEIAKELESRKGEVQTMKELERQEMEGEEYGGVYRSGNLVAVDDLTDSLEREIKDYVKTSNPYKVIIKDKNHCSLYNRLLCYFDKYVVKEKKIEKDNNYFRFNVIFDLEEEVKNLNDANTLIQNLEIKIEMKNVSNDQCIIEWSKLKGDKMEFFELFQQFVESF